MRSGNLQTPRICQRMMDFTAQCQQVGMPQREHPFLTLFPFGPDDELDVHRIRVANRNAGLQPAKFNLPNPAKGIGTSFKSARIIGHLLSDYQMMSVTAFHFRRRSEARTTMPAPISATVAGSGVVSSSALPSTTLPAKSSPKLDPPVWTT